MITVLNQQPIVINAALFAAAASGVWFAGSRLAIYADAISDRKRIGQAFMGLVFVAAATSLPEMVTTLFGALEGEAKLVLGNMFGGIPMQTAILALADALFATAALTSYPRGVGSALEATLLIALLAMLLALHAMGEIVRPFGVGLGTLSLAIAYITIIALLRRHGDSDTWRPVEVPETAEPLIGEVAPKALDRVPLATLVTRFVFLSLVILLCGLVLTATAAALAEQTGLGSSFIGVTLLACATSLPEVSTTFAAVRIGAYSLAISNIFGSNLLMIALVFPADLAYAGGPILRAIDPSTTFALIAGLLVTAIYLAGLLIRSRRTIAGMGVDSALVLLAYAAMLVVFYRLAETP
ncbi:MAG: sodium:calcium antiporter [Actinomycetota bacterium]